MLLVRKIHVMKMNSSEWLAATAHPSRVWQGAHTAGAWAAQALTAGPQLLFTFLRFRDTGRGSPQHTQSTALPPLTRCTSVSTQHPWTQGAAGELLSRLDQCPELNIRAQAGQSLISRSEVPQNTRKGSHCTSLAVLFV